MEDIKLTPEEAYKNFRLVELKLAKRHGKLDCLCHAISELSHEYDRAVKDIASFLDPKFLQINFWYGNPFNPYGHDLCIVEELRTSVRMLWAQDPVTSTWIAFSDFPEAAQQILYQRWNEMPREARHRPINDEFPF